MKATTSLSVTPLVETSFPVKSDFSIGGPRPRDVTWHNGTADAHRLCQRQLDFRLRPGGVPL